MKEHTSNSEYSDKRRKSFRAAAQMAGHNLRSRTRKAREALADFRRRWLKADPIPEWAVRYFEPGDIIHKDDKPQQVYIVLEHTCKCCLTCYRIRSQEIWDIGNEVFKEGWTKVPVVKDGKFDNNTVYKLLN